MSRSTWAEWDPPLRSRFGGFTPVAATGHGYRPLRKRFTRATLEAAIVEGVRERQHKEKLRRAALAIKRIGK